MKKLLTIFTLCVFSMLAANCSSSKKTVGADPAASETAVAEVKKNFTQQQMEEGRTIWQGNCNKCHKLYTPESHTVQQWESILPRMVQRAKLSESQAGNVRAYILPLAKRS